MIRVVKLGIICVVPAILSACSIHPVQMEATKLSAREIVRQIRCETRLAIETKAIEMLEQQDHPGPNSLALAQRLRKGDEEFRTIRTSELTQKELVFYKRYITTGIGYDFSFDITEDNSAGISADPIHLLSRGSVSAGLGGSGDLKRQNLRHFQVSDTFGSLLNDERLQCKPPYPTENFVYPVAGRIGMYELIANFVDLNEDKNLLPLEKGSPKVYVDQLTFTTTLTGSASPQIILNPTGNLTGVQPAGFSLAASRSDKHGLILGLSQEAATGATPTSALAPSAAASVFAPGGRGRQTALAPSSKISSQEIRALEAISQQRIDTFYDRFSTRF